jgi:hypothetical protein
MKRSPPVAPVKNCCRIACAICGSRAETAATEYPLFSASRPPNTPKKLLAGGSKCSTADPDAYVAMSLTRPA